MADFESAFELAERIKKDTIYRNVPLDRQTCFSLWGRSLMDARMFNKCVVDEGIRGFLIGVVAPFEFNRHEHYASDLFYLVEKGHPGGVRLLAEFTKWAEANPKVRMVIMGVTAGDGRPLGPLYERMGMDQVGGMFVKGDMQCRA